MPSCNVQKAENDSEKIENDRNSILEKEKNQQKAFFLDPNHFSFFFMSYNEKVSHQVIIILVKSQRKMFYTDK